MSKTYDSNLRRLRLLAAENGLVLNSDTARLEMVAGRMAKNYDEVEEWVCPCKQQHRPPVKGQDKTCPCPEWLEEIALDGCCHCRLFFSSEGTTQTG